MQINIADLRAATEKLLDHVEEQFGDSIEIEDDYYWEVPGDSRLDPYNEPSQLDIGQLSDDWNEVLGIAAGEKEPLSYALVWLSALLRTLGDKLVV
jgi:hypothetical protein